MLSAGVVAVATLALVAPMASASVPGNTQPTREEPLRVLFMGDSLAYESRDYFEFVIGYGERAVVDDSLVFGGTAICDWLEPLPKKLRRFRPDIAVVEFAGNSVTSCMQDPVSERPFVGDAVVDKYWDDARAAMRIFSRFGVTVYWVDAPASCATPERPLTSVYIRTVSKWKNAEYIDADGALNPSTSCTRYLPCLDGEPCTAIDPRTGERVAEVRAPDGLHFCPGGAPAVGGVTAECSVWSSGAWRYATAVALPLIQEYELTPPTAPLVPAPPPELAAVGAALNP